MTSAARRLEVQKLVGYVLVALIVLGLAYLVHWVVTEAGRPRYPGIEKLRGDAYRPAASQLVASAVAGEPREWVGNQRRAVV